MSRSWVRVCVAIQNKPFGSKWCDITSFAGKPGDVMLFPGLLQHCAMPNDSRDPRSAVILQFLPKFVRPMEDLKRSIAASILHSASPVLRKMLLVDYPYPAVLDESLVTIRGGDGPLAGGGVPKYDL